MGHQVHWLHVRGYANGSKGAQLQRRHAYYGNCRNSTAGMDENGEQLCRTTRTVRQIRACAYCTYSCTTHPWCPRGQCSWTRGMCMQALTADTTIPGNDEPDTGDDILLSQYEDDEDDEDGDEDEDDDGDEDEDGTHDDIIGMEEDELQQAGEGPGNVHVVDTHSSRERFLMQWVQRWTRGNAEEREARAACRRSGVPMVVPSTQCQGYDIGDVLRHIHTWKQLPENSPEFKAATEALWGMLDSLEEQDFASVSEAMLD